MKTIWLLFVALCGLSLTRGQRGTTLQDDYNPVEIFYFHRNWDGVTLYEHNPEECIAHINGTDTNRKASKKAGLFVSFGQIQTKANVWKYRPDNTIMVACQGLTRRLVSDDAKRYQVQPDLAHTWELVMGRIMTVEGKRIFQQIPNVNGQWGSWHEHECVNSCGRGVRLRTRSCDHPRPSGVGEGCDGHTRDIFELVPCEVNRPCQTI